MLEVCWVQSDGMDFDENFIVGDGWDRYFSQVDPLGERLPDAEASQSREEVSV